VECALSMEQRRKQGSFATVKDALSKLRMVECALSMEQRREQGSFATVKEGQTRCERGSPFLPRAQYQVERGVVDWIPSLIINI